ncbi:MAG TPA: hypothetical protein VEQ58_20055 [Polyangiaceae bacterium]|nr:hypothetical protein [Polyangiaceae bacterium]
MALAGLPFFASCTSSEDTEPFIPAVEGAKQPSGSGKLVSEDAACERVLAAAKSAYARLGCDAPKLGDCPGFVRPAGGSGCFEYYETSVAACESSYKDAGSCRTLSPCIVTAERNDSLSSCELDDGDNGMGGQPVGAAGADAGGVGQGGSSGAPDPDAPADEAGAGGVSGSAG